MSYPNFTQQSQSGMYPNGIPPQLQQQHRVGPQLPPQMPGINKFLPPTNQNVSPNPLNTQVGFIPNVGNPPVANNIKFAQNVLLTNGGSSHSSRTASPALNNTQNPLSNSPFLPPSSNYMPMAGLSAPPLQQQNAHQNPNLPPVSSALNRSTGPYTGSNQNIANLPPASNLQNRNIMGSTQNVSNLSNSMQNLALSQTNSNGPMTPQSANMNQQIRPTPPPPASSYQTATVTPTNANNPSTTLNQYTSQITTGGVNTTPVTTKYPPPSGLQQQQQQQHQNQPKINGSHNQAIPPMSATSPNHQPPTSAYQTMANTANVTPPSQIPMSNTTPSNQYSLNNNQQIQSPMIPQQQNIQSQLPPPQLQQQHQQQQQQYQPSRKPMYPNVRPPMQQQPQQPQPYAAAYPQQQPQPTFNGQPNTSQLQYQQGNYNQMSVAQQGFSKLWGQDSLDLMQHRHILPNEKVQPPPIILNNQFYESVNCSPEIMRCTVTKIPESNNLLQKSRLPLGILIHPFRDMSNLVVINCPTIVRCRLCRTYINPFVHFVDSKMWKCNLCYRINELPEDFQYDPASKTYGEVTRRPEVRSSTIEFIAPSEYMLRPPQPAIYLFLFDVSMLAQQSGYLETVCSTLSKHLENMPGDARTKVGFIAYNSEIHFYNIAEGYNQPHEITLVDIDDVFLPCPDNLLINVKACKDLIKDLLSQLPTRFANSHDSGSALGAALQVAYKLMSAPGGRITVFQTCLPNKGPGLLQPREDPNNRSAKDVLHLNPATDFYKRQALECSGQQIAVDLFLLNQQYSDLATLSGVSKYSGGCIYHFPLYQKTKQHLVDTLKRSFERYLTRKIGFEAVMRVRCTRGLQIHTFHGNFFVRSTDLLSLPNVNPDAGYGMQISYEESLTDIKTICFQAALLYTTSNGERRIRVHTMCLPITNSLSEVMYSADVQCIVGLLAKMAVDRSLSSNIADARDAFINVTIDIINAFKVSQNLPAAMSGQIVVPKTLSLLPLYILALLKNVAFRTGTSTRLDDRIFAMDAMKTLPLDLLMKYIYPEFYHIDSLFYNCANENEDTEPLDPPILQLSAEHIDSRSFFLLDCGCSIILYVGLNVQPNILQNILGVQTTAEISDYCYGLPSLNTPESKTLRDFIDRLNENKPYDPVVQIIRDTSTARSQFFEKFVDDRSESSVSYYEFLQHLRTQVK